MDWAGVLPRSETWKDGRWRLHSTQHLGSRVTYPTLGIIGMKTPPLLKHVISLYFTTSLSTNITASSKLMGDVEDFGATIMGHHPKRHVVAVPAVLLAEEVLILAAASLVAWIMAQRLRDRPTISISEGASLQALETPQRLIDEAHPNKYNIAICGPSRSGKSTMVSALREACAGISTASFAVWGWMSPQALPALHPAPEAARCLRSCTTLMRLPSRKCR